MAEPIKYGVTIYFEDNEELERRIEKAVGRSAEWIGSGAAIGGLRDTQYEWQTELARDRAADRLQEIPGLDSMQKYKDDGDIVFERTIPLRRKSSGVVPGTGSVTAPEYPVHLWRFPRD
jgi:hypothetical protein